ncbi:MAG: hypothetical protein CV087_08290 [Candidatus Brocadia sp. WS118]|nr:MAG: hypothetical protein CV087_08290 [Candidatus Brocadia sp. WS118]
MKKKSKSLFDDKIGKPCWFIAADKVYQGVLKESRIVGQYTQPDKEYRLTITNISTNGSPAKNLGDFTNAIEGCHYSKAEKEIYVDDYNVFFSLQDILKELRKQIYYCYRKREHWREQYMTTLYRSGHNEQE